MNNQPKLKIVLFEWRLAKSFYKWISLGIQYIASVLREKGYPTEIFLFEGETVETVTNTIISLKPDVVGVHFYRETQNFIFSVTHELKKINSELFIMAGGHTASVYASRILLNEESIDAVIVGEGEETVIELCSRLEKKISLKNCPGIHYKEKGLVYRNDRRMNIKNLDTLPFPAVDIPIQKTDRLQKSVFLSISTSRGCLGNCSFCVEHRVSKDGYNVKWRGRSPRNIIQEINYLASKFTGKRLLLHFVDGSIEDPDPENKERLIELINNIDEINLPLAFSFLTRAESWSGKDEALIKKMRQAGLYSISIGFESGSQETLNLFNKRARVEDNKIVNNLFKQFGIGVFGFLIMYHPYTLLKDLLETAQFLNELNMAYRPEVWFHDLVIYPDTRIFRKIVDDGLLLGTDETGLAYSYAFTDGRVAKIYKVMQELKDTKGVNGFKIIEEKIYLEFLLYNLWKNKIDELNGIDHIMQPYFEAVHEIFKQAGNKQYTLFCELVSNIENNLIPIDKKAFIQEWDSYLAKQQNVLEKLRLKIIMELGRKKISII